MSVLSVQRPEIMMIRRASSGGLPGGVLLLCLLSHAAAAAPPSATRASGGGALGSRGHVSTSSKPAPPLVATPSLLPASGPASGPAVLSGARSEKDPRALLREALGLYLRGRYAAAAAHLDPLVQQRSLADRADQIQALRSYGVALYLSGARAGAERAFRNLLRLAPDERLDPDFVKPRVVQFFDDVRRRYRRELDAVVARSAPKGSAVINLLPPWGQFQNGHRKKAFWILGGLLATGAAAITTFGIWEGLVHPDGTFDIGDSAAQGLKIGNLVALGLFVGIYVYGVVDGLVYYFRRRRAQLGAVSRRGSQATLAWGMDGLRLVF